MKRCRPEAVLLLKVVVVAEANAREEAEFVARNLDDATHNTLGRCWEVLSNPNEPQFTNFSEYTVTQSASPCNKSSRACRSGDR